MVNDNIRVERKFKSDCHENTPLKITRAKNINYTFLKGEPSIGWMGAEFTIETEGGSGNIHWEVENVISEIEISTKNDGSAHILIKDDPRREVLIKATDNDTGQSDTYSFYLRDFIRSDRQKHAFKEIQADYIKYMLPVVIYERLFTQWGDLQFYTVWSASVDETYWTNEQARSIDIKNEQEENIDCGTEHTSAKYTVFDVRTGVKSISKISSKIKKYFMYQLP